ncbi:MAG: TldD/PmbA family protein [Acidimicrobiales bacterium]|nr:TldD/PmbA family protein [Acidimicrobiales bacterium]
MTGARRGPGAQELVERALSLSRADGCAVIADETSDANLRWANNTLTSNGVTRARTVTVISVIGEAVGAMSRQGATPEDLPDLVAAAEATARSSAPAEDFSDLVGPAASSGAWDDPPAETSIGTFASFAPDLGEGFRRAEAGKQLLFGFAYHEMQTTFVGSTTGLRCRYDQPTGYVEINAKSDDMGRSSWVGMPTRDFADVDMPALTAELSRRLGWARRTTDLPAGRYDTVLPPSAVADLMIDLYWSASGREAHEGRTVFSRPGGGTRVGERLTPGPLTLRSDPSAPGIECPPFLTVHGSGDSRSVFDNGTRLEASTWISRGVLTSLVQTRHSARLTDLPFRPYIDNLILESADPCGGIEDLLVGVERGLLLTCLWYIREVDPRTLLLTGLTRDGVYLVERGEVTAAVNNFRFNESPVDLLARAVAVGSSERTLPREWSDYFTRVAMPPVRVADFNMSSVSQAS